MANELPSRSGAFRRCAVVAAISAAAAVLIAGCSAGQDTQTVNQRPPIDGASTDAGAISIRTASVMTDDLGDSSTKGGSAQLRLVIINNSPQQVELQSVSSPVAGGAQVSSAGTSDTLSPGAGSSSSDTLSPGPGSSSVTASASASSSASASGSAATSASATASGSATGSGTPSGSATGSGTPSGSASTSVSASASVSATPANTPIPIPAGQSVQVGFSTDGPSISLTGLTTELFPAQAVPVTFTFGDGTTINLNLPVQLPSSAASAPVVSDATEPAEPNN